MENAYEHQAYQRLHDTRDHGTAPSVPGSENIPSRQLDKLYETHRSSSQQQQQQQQKQTSHGATTTKKLDRILANRRSARRSRERRKQLQENLEKSIFFLTQQNQVLSVENKQLKDELSHLMDVYNKISLQVLATLENNNLNRTTTSAIPGTACLPSHNNNYNLASVQELLLYMAALSNSNNGNNNYVNSGNSGLPLNVTGGTGVTSSIPASMVPTPTITNTMFNMSTSTNANNIHLSLLNNGGGAGNVSDLGGMGFMGLGGGGGGNHMTPSGVFDSNNFAYSGGITNPSSSLVSSLQYNDSGQMDSLHGGQQTSFGRIFNGATNLNDVRRF